VIAGCEETVSRARALIHVDYEGLPVVVDPFEAASRDSPRIHPTQDTNPIDRVEIPRGDSEQGFQRADVIVESVYRTPPHEHAYLEPEAGLADIDEEDRVTVVAGGQWAHEEQRQVAHALGLGPDQVRIIHPVIGGAFGGKQDVSIQIVLGLAALHLQRLHYRTLSAR